ncbi:chorismate lyase [Immundisolibacter sp.]|uniref:chorismate--pyruvate lyase family protein n=1 Tax=Immundisolibacter sp. TaxID=1934948 RepID=UPI002616A8C0|nr:chorismate lyase [Immundisolibacter sp.]MDD3650474.1 chorismate lyase [Immundisolibacter sp.]
MTPGWRPLSAAALRGLPAPLRPLAGDAGSVTAALRRVCGAALECRLLAHGVRAATVEEAGYLRLAAGAMVFWRRVRFRHAGRTLLIGHTLVPVGVLAQWPALRRLGDRPIGELLFADPAVRRQGIELARAAPLPGVPALFARRARVPAGRGHIAVMEHFLPPMLRLPLP